MIKCDYINTTIIGCGQQRKKIVNWKTKVVEVREKNYKLALLYKQKIGMSVILQYQLHR